MSRYSSDVNDHHDDDVECNIPLLDLRYNVFPVQDSCGIMAMDVCCTDELSRTYRDDSRRALLRC